MNLPSRKSWLLILLVLDLIIFGSVLIPPGAFWPAIFFGYMIPPLMGLHLLMACGLLLFKRSKRNLTFAGVLIVATFPFWQRTFQWNLQAQPDGASISLLSYNAKLFRQPGVYDRFSMEMIDWIVDEPSAIKCIQEFSSNDRWAALDVKGQITEKGYYAVDYKAQLPKFGDHSPGMAIFSKYPIVDYGILPKKYDGFNAIMFADLVIAGDTLRVYNIHLRSYHLGAGGKTGFFGRVRQTLAQVKNVVIYHTAEIQQLSEHIAQCKWPYVVAGDFNESPYSYNYGQLQHLPNGFEVKGNGFGFTLVKPPLLLRIDQVFFDPELPVQSFEVVYRMDISDHYPIRTTFAMPSK